MFTPSFSPASEISGPQWVTQPQPLQRKVSIDWAPRYTLSCFRDDQTASRHFSDRTPIARRSGGKSSNCNYQRNRGLRDVNADDAAVARAGKHDSSEFVRLHSDDSGKEPILLAERSSGARIRVEAMSEGTLDQLYLALRLAALDVRRAAGVDVPVILEDALMTSDDDRSGVMLEALADFARGNQVMVFTHHRHIADIAVKHVPHDVLAPLDL
jgi:hypothetical protein